MATKKKIDVDKPSEDEDLVDASYENEDGDVVEAAYDEDESADEQALGDVPRADVGLTVGGGGGDDGGETGEGARTPASLGATKYVHAAFFGAGILVAYLSGKLLWTAWNNLAEWPTAVRAVPQLLRYAEDDRQTFSMIGGALIGVVAVIQTYRKEHIRRWADEVAIELSKVTWPDKETVTNGTVVVVIASAVATVYIALLDKFWGFLTTLVYGA